MNAAFLAVRNNPGGYGGGAGTVGEDCRALSEVRCDPDSGRMFCDVYRSGRTLFLLKKYRNYPGVVIVRAFTKLYAMPGVRLGYLVCSDAALTEAIRADLPEWNLSVFAQQAGCGLRAACVYGALGGICLQGRAWLTEQLSEIGITVFASNANFLMIKDGRPLAKELLKKDSDPRLQQLPGLSGDITGLRSDGARRMNACLRRWRR